MITPSDSLKTKPKQTQSNPTCSEFACGELVEPVEGVEPISKAKKMLLRLTINGRRESFGYYADEIKAAKAYDQAAKKYYRDFAVLNFDEYF